MDDALEAKVAEIDRVQWHLIGLIGLVALSLLLKGGVTRMLETRVNNLTDEMAFVRELVRLHDVQIGARDD
jgi:hypothetical protein